MVRPTTATDKFRSPRGLRSYTSVMDRRFRPLYGLALVSLIVGGLFLTDLFLDGGFGDKRFERVGPDKAGLVQLGVGDLGRGDVRFFRFLNSGNQEVRFFVARDRHGELQVALDANEVCYKLKRGYTPSGEWLVCNKCEKSFRVDEVNAGGGGCKPIPLKFTQEDAGVVLSEAEILTGWRYFR